MSQNGEVLMFRGRRIAGSFVTGLASLVTIIDPAPKNFAARRTNSGSALEGDFSRIGIDMHKAVKNERDREKAVG